MNKNVKKPSNTFKKNEQILNKKRFIILYIIVLILLIISITYAITSSPLAFNLTTGKIAIDFAAYGNTTFDASKLDLRPILDSTIDTSTDNVIKIEFKVGGASTNNTNNIIYDIALNDLRVDCSLLSPYIKWKLVKNGAELSTGSLDYKFDTITNERLVLTNIQQDLPAFSEIQEGYDSYIFYLWFSDSCQEDLDTCQANDLLYNQDTLLGKRLEGKIEVELNTKTKKTLIRNPSSVLDSSSCVTY